jgi:hypothetical protein
MLDELRQRLSFYEPQVMHHPPTESSWFGVGTDTHLSIKANPNSTVKLEQSGNLTAKTKPPI